MPQKKLNPVPQGSAGRVPKEFICVTAMNASEPTRSPLDLQTLRASWIARRCAVSPDLAVFIASLALGEVSA